MVDTCSVCFATRSFDSFPMCVELLLGTETGHKSTVKTCHLNVPISDTPQDLYSLSFFVKLISWNQDCTHYSTVTVFVSVLIQTNGWSLSIMCYICLYARKTNKTPWFDCETNPLWEFCGVKFKYLKSGKTYLNTLRIHVFHMLPWHLP